ncbi:hypothetical protein JCM11641_002633 [Rhodosporidiobolus odoratus]
MARNTQVAAHIGKLSRSKLYAKKGQYKRQHTTAPGEDKSVEAKEVEAKSRVQLKGSAEETSFYPGEDVKQKKASRKTVRPTKIRSSITPGTVLILLAGRFRGKRVVALGTTATGLIVVSGPYKVNGVPLRRVNQAYVIATSTKVDLSGFSLDAKFDDAYFSKEKSSSRNGKEGEFFGEGKEKKAFPADRAADQKSVDAAVLKAVAATPNLAKYLNATFGLTKGQYPHLLKF